LDFPVFVLINSTFIKIKSYKNLYSNEDVIIIVKHISNYKGGRHYKIVELKEILKDKKLLIGLKESVISDFPDRSLLESVGQERIDSLKKATREINQLVEERKKLSLDFIKEGEELKTEINNFIIENESILRNLNDVPGQNEALVERISLRNKKTEISELQLNEKVNCWKDIALLKKELRIYEKELSEKESRIKELNELLNEH